MCPCFHVVLFAPHRGVLRGGDNRSFEEKKWEKKNSSAWLWKRLLWKQVSVCKRPTEGGRQIWRAQSRGKDRRGRHKWENLWIRTQSRADGQQTQTGWKVLCCLSLNWLFYFEIWFALVHVMSLLPVPLFGSVVDSMSVLTTNSHCRSTFQTTTADNSKGAYRLISPYRDYSNRQKFSKCLQFSFNCWI